MTPASPTTILCVDDNAATRYVFGLALREAGFEVREAATGAAALRLAAEAPDLIILDVHLPDVDGFQVCAQIKANPATAAIPVLHLSGMACSAHDKAVGLGGGADGYLTKPVEMIELLAHVHALLRVRRAEQAVRASEERLRLILETAYEAFIGLDQEGRVLEWNRQAQSTFGWSRAEAVGRPLTELVVPARFRAGHLHGLERAAASAEGPVWNTRLEVQAVRKDGREFPAEVMISLVRSGGGCLFNAFVRDLSDAKRAELQQVVRLAVSKALVESATLTEATTRILQAVCEITGWDAGAVWRVDRQAGALRCLENWSEGGVDAAAFEARTRRLTLASGEGLPGRAWAAGAPAWLPNGSALGADGRAAAEAGFQAALAFPVPFGTEVTGVIEFFSRRPRPPEELLALLGIPTSQIGQFFERKRAEEAQAESLRLTALAVAVGLALSKTDALAAMLAGCTEAMVACLDAALARIWTLGPEADELVLQASAGVYTHLDGAHSRVPVGSLETGRIAQDRRPYWTNDLSSDPRISNKDWAARQGLTAFAGFPLLAGDRLIGVLALFARHPFSEVALQALAPAADNIAMSIQRWEAEHTQRATEEEFRAARRIQQNLFPKVGPTAPGFDVGGASFPAASTGGDYYDFFPLCDGTLGVVIGDVSGHGMGPALLMASTRAYLHALALTQIDPSTLLALVNQALVDDAQDQFITLLLARLDPGSRRLTYSSAGHTPGYVLDPDGRMKARLDSTGKPLGILPGEVFPCGDAVTLEPGQCVVLLTDGVVEARAPDDSVFGVDRALGIVRLCRRESAGRIVDNLLHAVRAFARDRPPPDDLSAVVIKAAHAP